MAISGAVTVGIVGNSISGNIGNGLNLDIYQEYYQQNGGISASGITGNSVFGNGGVGVRIGGNQPSMLTLSGNDIYNNTGFEIRNESGISITAENVYLGKETAAEFGNQDSVARSGAPSRSKLRMIRLSKSSRSRRIHRCMWIGNHSERRSGSTARSGRNNGHSGRTERAFALGNLHAPWIIRASQSRHLPQRRHH